MSTTPRTDARLSSIRISREDESAQEWVYINGREYHGQMIDTDFARELECENAKLREALRQARENLASMKSANPDDWPSDECRKNACDDYIADIDRALA